MKKLTLEEFINRSNLIHDYKYDYSLVDYINTRTYINIKCKDCGNIFSQTPDSHIYQKSGCPICGGTCKYTTESFIKKSKQIFGDLYDYSFVNYINNKTEVIIKCETHGIFSKLPCLHLRGFGCEQCSYDKLKLTQDCFIEKAKLIHGDKYDYSLVVYTGTNNNVDIKCDKHNIFKQIPHSHLKGSGCPQCNESKGEQKIKEFLEKYNIIFFKQYKFDDCKNIKILKFDFYIPLLNLCIEFDGLQHFKPIEYFGGINTYEKIKINDNIKNDYCKNNNIKLLRIS